MKKEQFYETIGDIDDRLINEADKPAMAKPRTWRYIAAAAACLVICVGVGAALNNSYRKKLPPNSFTIDSSLTEETENESTKTTQAAQQTEIHEIEPSAAASVNQVLAEAVYPEMPQYPDESLINDWNTYEPLLSAWDDANRSLRDQPEGYDKGIDGFFKTTVGTFMTGDVGENKAYSPLSLYMALGMSAEISDGNTRQQFLDLLGQYSIKEMRSHAKSVWESSYKNDGMATCVLANSFWANCNIPCKQRAADSLAKNYFASSYVGDPATDEYNAMFREWLDKQTDDLLTDYTKDLKMDPQSVLTLASTINFAGKWIDKFDKSMTDEGVFHAPSGDVSCEMMHSDRTAGYFWGEKFGSISLRLENNGEMRLILPDEGVSPEELFSDDEALNYMLWNIWKEEYPNHKYPVVHLSLPKFDVSSSIDLIDGLKAMGVTDAFDSTVSDFTPLTDEAKVALSKAEQDARVMIDEEGCRAAAMTVMAYAGGSMPDEEIELVFDRPFVFEIVGENGLPLFVGVVNTPN